MNCQEISEETVGSMFLFRIFKYWESDDLEMSILGRIVPNHAELGEITQYTGNLPDISPLLK